MKNSTVQSRQVESNRVVRTSLLLFFFKSDSTSNISGMHWQPRHQHVELDQQTGKSPGIQRGPDPQRLFNNTVKGHLHHRHHHKILRGRHVGTTQEGGGASIMGLQTFQTTPTENKPGPFLFFFASCPLKESDFPHVSYLETLNRKHISDVFFFLERHYSIWDKDLIPSHLIKDSLKVRRHPGLMHIQNHKDKAPENMASNLRWV